MYLFISLSLGSLEAAASSISPKRRWQNVDNKSGMCWPTSVCKHGIKLLRAPWGRLKRQNQPELSLIHRNSFAYWLSCPNPCIIQKKTLSNFAKTPQIKRLTGCARNSAGILLLKSSRYQGNKLLKVWEWCPLKTPRLLLFYFHRHQCYYHIISFISYTVCRLCSLLPAVFEIGFISNAAQLTLYSCKVVFNLWCLMLCCLDASQRLSGGRTCNRQLHRSVSSSLKKERK